MTKTYRLFIFDFDGTLGDTSECVVQSFKDSFKKNNLPPADRKDIVHLMGLSLPQVFRRLTDSAHEEELYDKLVEDYRKFYRTYLTLKTREFPGIKDTLLYLKSRQALCTVATSKKTEFAKLSCKFLKIDQFIDFYIGDDKVDNKKPHPEMLKKTLNKFGVKAHDAVMIGDATTDIQMGRSAGADTIAVSWGSHSRDMLVGAGPTHVVDEARELMIFA